VADGFTYSYDWNNDGNFTSPGDIANSPNASAQHSYADGHYKVHGRITNSEGLFSDVYTTVSVGVPSGVVNTRYVVTGADAGGGPQVNVYNTDGTLKFKFFAYDSTFTGGVRVAVGDINGDGVDDIVTVAGPGGGPHVRVFNGVDGSLMYSFFATNPNYTGGLTVATGDVNADGFTDFIVGFGPNSGGGRVMVFSGKDSSVLKDFFSYAPTFTGSVNVASADVNGDGKSDIITGAGAGGGPHVQVFDGATGGVNIQPTALFSFFAFNSTFNGGIYVAAADVNGDGQADMIVGLGAEPGTDSRVRVFNGLNSGLLFDFVPFAAFRGGVRVAADDLDGDGKADLIIGNGPGMASRLLALKGTNLSSLLDFAPFDPTFLGGVFVG